MKRKLLASLLALCMAVGMAAPAASAAEPEDTPPQEARPALPVESMS